MRVFRGLVVFGGMVLFGTVVLVVLSIGAMVALSIGFLLMPGLMLLVWVLVRRRRRAFPRDQPARRAASTRFMRRSGVLPGRATGWGALMAAGVLFSLSGATHGQEERPARWIVFHAGGEAHQRIVWQDLRSGVERGLTPPGQASKGARGRPATVAASPSKEFTRRDSRSS